MKSTTPIPLRQRHIRLATLCAACVLLLPLAPPSIADGGSAHDEQRFTPERIHLAQRRQCEQRMGPFVTQETAWQRWRQARAQGHTLSQGVVPCYGQGIRGYCFFVFTPC